MLVKNAGNYPVYLLEYSLNNKKIELGHAVIPTGLDNWFAIPVSPEIQKEKKIKLEIKFEDYLNRQYICHSEGMFNGVNWEIKTEKKVPPNKE